MQQYLANIISLSRLFYALYMVYRYTDRRFEVRLERASKAPFLWAVFLFILSDKVDGMVAQRFGSTPHGAEIDRYADRVAILALYYFIYPKSWQFVLLAIPEILMTIWSAIGLWPSQQLSELIHPAFPYHLGRVSITLQASGGFLLLINRLHQNRYRWLAWLGSICLWFGAAMTWLAVIVYPLWIYYST